MSWEQKGSTAQRAWEAGAVVSLVRAGVYEDGATELIPAR